MKHGLWSLLLLVVPLLHPRAAAQPQAGLAEFGSELPAALTRELPDGEAETFSSRRELLRELLSRFDARHGHSRRQEWRRISGWQAFHPLRPTTWDEEPDNHHPAAYALPEGRESAALDFITFGMVYFDMPESSIEDSLKCRTPRKYAYYRRLFPRYQAMPERRGLRCRSSSDGFLDDIEFIDPVLGEPVPMGPVDGETVEGFELLYATPGTDDLAEVAGHLVLRVRLRNNPGATALGIENPRDLVISFLADTPSPAPSPARAPVCHESWIGGGYREDFDPVAGTIQALKGLSGGLLTVMHRATLAQTVRSYTWFQDRDLLRYRLNLSEEQKAALLRRLYIAKKNFSTRYFFFDQNCASILVQIIGEGIGDDRLARPGAPLLPPHSLISGMVRRGLLTRVWPAFSSYRRTGQGARLRLAEAHGRLSGSVPELGEFLADDDEVRAAAYAGIGQIRGGPERIRTAWRLLAYGQIAELAWQDIRDPCTPYTSAALMQARTAARQLLVRAGTDGLQARDLAVDAGLQVDAGLEEIDRADDRGSSYTGLLDLAAGVEHHPEAGHGAWLQGSFFRQDMGSPSRFAMQRAAAVRLGELDLRTGIAGGGLRRYLFTGLSIEKFREQLKSVPAIHQKPGHWGLGLGALTVSRDRRTGHHRFIPGSISGLFNLRAGPGYEDHLYGGVGLNLFCDDPGDLRRCRPGLPWKLSGLFTPDARRVWQIRYEVGGLIYSREGSIRRETGARVGLHKRFVWSRREEGRISFMVTREATPEGASPLIYQWGVGYRSH